MIILAGNDQENCFCQVLTSRTKEDTGCVDEYEAHDSRCEGFFHVISPFLYFYIYYRKTTQKALAQNVMTRYDICHQKNRAELGLDGFVPKEIRRDVNRSYFPGQMNNQRGCLFCLVNRFE